MLAARKVSVGRGHAVSDEVRLLLGQWMRYRGEQFLVACLDTSASYSFIQRLRPLFSCRSSLDPSFLDDQLAPIGQLLSMHQDWIGKHTGAWMAEHKPLKRLYLCPQATVKLHPAFDFTIREVLRRDEEGLWMLLAGTNPILDAMIALRMVTATLRHALVSLSPDDSMPQDNDTVHQAFRTTYMLLSRARIGPQRSHNAFLRLLSVAHVVVDPYPFGGCTTTYEAMLHGVQVVTMPGLATRNRFSQALLRQLEPVHQHIVHSPDELITRAIMVSARPKMCGFTA